MCFRSIHAQQQSIIGEFGIIHGLGVNQQGSDDTAKLQQGMPVPAIARQSRCLNAEDRADLPVAQFAQEALKTGTRCTGARDSEIVVDHLNVLPAQRTRMIDEGVLPPLAFQVVLYLPRCGLADIHASSPRQVLSVDLIHRRPPCGLS